MSHTSKKTSESKKALSEKNFRYIILLAIIFILVVIFASVKPVFLQFSNLMNMARQVSVLAIVSIGMTYVILTGGIDLSVGSNIAFAGAVAAIAVNSTGSAMIGFVSAMLAGLIIGTINGSMIGYYGISPFMATLATMSLARGLTLTISGAAGIKVKDTVFNFLGQNSLGPIPVVVFAVFVLYAASFILLTRMTFGRKVYAVGGNINAAKASGILAERELMKVYMITGLLCGIGAIITVGRATSAQPWAGLGLEFEVVTAVVLGGTSLLGGKGSLEGTFLGSLLVGVLANGLGLMDVSPYIQYIIKGVMILLAVLIDEASIKIREVKKIEKNSENILPEEYNKKFAFENIKTAKVLKLTNISKEFPGVKALDGVNLTIKRGTVMALMGENGAGKSTLMKILAGVYKKDRGEIKIEGVPVEINSPLDAQKLGIAVIHQEFSLIPELTVAQNIFLGKELYEKNRLLLDKKSMSKKAKELVSRFDMDIDVNLPVKNLTVGQQQMIEIAKALASDAWIIVMDEPTSALSEADKNSLFKLIRELKRQGVAIVYISHRMPEIFEIADEVTVLRDGRYVASEEVNRIDESTLIKYMVGRELKDIFHREKAEPGRVVLEVKNLTKSGVFNNISFKVREGEVLGLSGLMGAGRSEIVRCIFGLDPFDKGEILIDGKALHIQKPLDAIRAGMGLVPEDRRKDGFVPLMSVRENLSLPSLPWINTWGWIDRKTEGEIAAHYISALEIKTPSHDQALSNLSGGNQQKCVLGKWLARNPRIIILDEPTRGVDVGAKAEIHRIIEGLAQKGVAIIMISSELPEILGVSDRIIVLHEGTITGEYDAASASQEKIMQSATGVACT
ncbi:ATP-binding cassette domain-containing protein [Biomaibacter acetigenes]|uniref:ATP-binding cassette domain-containing protein n=1 Tax=Biomaibacter acetigenes TaxID=2316383 RepID=A0A3G2R251_9FIRM|nr:ATP-binding cassette domain-containing protein [Biomaibacter acetigenes]AYO29208.1 ATP-binding cassette domain-containing protein [Biomaibacter acetigenes]